MIRVRRLAVGLAVLLALGFLTPLAVEQPSHSAPTLLNTPPFVADEYPHWIWVLGDAWLFTSRKLTPAKTTYYFTGDRSATWVTPPPPADGWEARADVSEFRRLVLGSCTTTPCAATTARLEGFNGTGVIRTVRELPLPADVGQYETLQPRWYDGYYWAMACSTTGGATATQHKVTLLRISEAGAITAFARTDGKCGTSADIAKMSTGQLRVRRDSAFYDFTGSSIVPLTGSYGWAPRSAYGLEVPSSNASWRVGQATFEVKDRVSTVDYGAGPITLSPGEGFVGGGATGLPLMRLNERAIMVDRGDGVFVPSYFFTRRPRQSAFIPEGYLVLTCPWTKCDLASDHRLEFIPKADFTTALTPTSTNSLFVTINGVREEVGLPPIFEDPVISQAAQNHSNYMTANGLGHDEIEGKPGFTGTSPPLRCAAVGTRCTGEIAAGAGGSTAIFRWLNGPLHGTPLLNPTELLAGGSSNSYLAVMNFDPFRGLSTKGFGFPKGTWDGPLTFLGGEIPDPRPRCPAAAGTTFGQPIYYYAPRGITIGAMRLSANGQDVPVCTLYPGVYFPMAALQQLTTYTVTIDTPGYVTPTDSWTFTTTEKKPYAVPVPSPSLTPNPTTTRPPVTVRPPTLSPGPANMPVDQAGVYQVSASARAFYRAGYVILAVRVKTMYEGEGVPTRVSLWRARGTLRKRIICPNTGLDGSLRWTSRMRAPVAQKARALRWYRKKWPEVVVVGTLSDLSRTVRVRVR